MVENFPGPYELRFSYDTTPTSLATLDHTQRLNIDLTAVPTPGDAFNNINAKTRGGVATPDLAAVVEAWLTLLAPMFRTNTTFGAVELWKYTPLSFQADFISAYNPVIVAGTSVLTAGEAQQDMFTLRTIEGGILRINLMEARTRVYARTKYPTTFVDPDAIFVFVIGTTNWILGRDTSYPFGALNYLVGQNEKLFRVRYR